MITVSNSKTFALKGKNVGPNPAMYKSNRAPNVWLWKESGVRVWLWKGTWVPVHVHREKGSYLNMKTKGCLIVIVERAMCLIAKRNGFALWCLNSKSPTNTTFLILKTSEYYLCRIFLKRGIKKVLFVVRPDKTRPEPEKPGLNLRKKESNVNCDTELRHTDSQSILILIPIPYFCGVSYRIVRFVSRIVWF